MMYVFHVDSGKMMRFDMSVALESVSSLKEQIEAQSRIPADKQVLLISGGECLDPNKRVCSYSAGTDTNPIFLFSKSIIESSLPPTPASEYSFDADIEQKIREHSDMPNTFNTVSKRAQLAQHLHDLAKEQHTVCEDLVHDQHLQQQGWSAVVANLEDITLEFRKRSEIFEKSFVDYMEERDSYLKFLTHFNKDLQNLQRIPVLSVLLELERQVDNIEGSKASEETTNTSQEESESSKEITLYEWISAADSKSTMDQLYDHCSRGLEQFDAQIFKGLKEEIEEMLRGADNPQMKEVKGLGERLFGLETLMREAKKFVKQQAELAQSFVNNQSRASNTKDSSILPDLCNSHKKQLQMMAQNHQQLTDIRRRCTRAKDELSTNLYHRLRWVMYIEDHILEIDQKLVIYHENLKRLRKHLEVLQQLHLAPATYLCAVAEVVRRRAFSQSFLLWASELACHLLTIHNEEVTRRKEFQSQFEGHFLNSLFPGMEDLPPSFATQAPSVFDSCLPKITEEDLERLKAELPDLADNLNVPDSTAITNFFLIKSLVKKEDEKQEDVQEKIGQAVDRLEMASVVGQTYVSSPGLAHVKELDRGCESETDTEEFEKVGQSPLELHFDKAAPSPRTQDASTCTEDNLQISRNEHDRLRSLLTRLHLLAQEALLQLRHEANELRSEAVSFTRHFSLECEKLGRTFLSVMSDRETAHQDALEGLRREHEVVLRGMRSEEERLRSEARGLSSDNEVLGNDVLKLRETVEGLKATMAQWEDEQSRRINDLQRQLADKDAEREKCVKDATDRLNREHKAQIENIRSRFKLMTMERSPSDTSLERSTDFSSLPTHATLLAQMTENFEFDKEKAVGDALRSEREKWETLLAERIRSLEEKFEFEKEAIVRQVSREVAEEKDKQIDLLMEREKNLNLECIKYKGTIQQLAEASTDSNSSGLLDKINDLEREKESLEKELDLFKTAERIGGDMAVSVAVCEGKVDVMTSPIRHKELMSRSEITIGSASKPGKLSVDSCKPGDLVFVIWDPRHGSFRIAQENKYLFFLHSDCVDALGLKVTDGQPNKLYLPGEVYDKEYCHARKSENRYKVPRGTKFFRVKVRPLPNLSRDVALAHSKSSSVESTTAAATLTQSQMSVSEEDAPTSPPSSPPNRAHPAILERDEPEIFQAESVENFAEDSGIVDSVEQARAAIEAGDDDEEDDNRLSALKRDKQHNWLETMLSRVFTKSVRE